MLEPVRKVEPSSISRIGIKVGEHFVHAAVLGVEHPLDLNFAHRLKDTFRPGRKSGFDVESDAVAGTTMGVAESRESLVQRVPRRPQSVEIKAGRADFTLRHGRPCFAPALKSAQITVAVFVLHFLEFINQVIGARFKLRITGREIHQTDARQVMTGNMAGKIAAATIPARVRLCFLRQAGAHPVERHHAVGFEFEQIFSVGILCRLERSSEQSDIGQRNQPRANHPFFETLDG